MCIKLAKYRYIDHTDRATCSHICPEWASLKYSRSAECNSRTRCCFKMIYFLHTASHICTILEKSLLSIFFLVNSDEYVLIQTHVGKGHRHCFNSMAYCVGHEKWQRFTAIRDRRIVENRRHRFMLCLLVTPS